MPEESSKSKDIAEAVCEIVKQVPVYKDAIQPAAKELGKSLEIISKAVSAALIPVEGLIWGADKIRTFVHTRVVEKLKDTPPEQINVPDLHVAGPTLEALKFCGHHGELSEMFANLLANSLDKETATSAHPSFVDLIKSLSPDEARILKLLATNNSYPIVDIHLKLLKGSGYHVIRRNMSTIAADADCDHLKLQASYLDNLERLGLISAPHGIRIKDDQAYERLLNNKQIKDILKSSSKEGESKCETNKRKIEVTDFGKQFIRVCVIDK
jgi:hypothetical protein